ncbi:MAG: rhodanese-like domain-containing protein [Chloroflexota bacterium]
MVQRINNAVVKELQEQGAQVVEVLPGEAYEQLHIAGAISLPLTDLNQESASQLDAQKPVILYCFDHQ